MGTVDLTEFWSSIINDNGLKDNLKSVLSVEDAEERALQLITRTLFLLIMEIKFERDEAVKNLKRIEENGSTCTKCKDVLKADKVSAVESTDSNYIEFRGKEDDIGSTNSPVKISITGEEIDQISDENINDSTLEAKDGTSTKSKKANRKYRCLSRSSNEKSPESNKDEGVTKPMGKNRVLKKAPRFFVPETMSLDDHAFHVDVLKRKALGTQAVSVPETLAMDDIETTGNKYENTDFFDGRGNKEVQDVGREMGSPSKGDALVTESDISPSPILGKANQMAVSDATKQAVRDLSKPLGFEDLDREPPTAASTPDSRNASSRTPKYSPLLFTHNLSTSLNNSDSVSPSLLTSVRGKSSGNGDHRLPTSSEKPGQERPSARARRGLRRSMSDVNTSPPSVKVGLKKCQTVNRGKFGNLTIEPPDPKGEKKYKQTKLSMSVFHQKMDGARHKGIGTDHDMAAMRAALEESLKSKAVEDMMRVKHEALRAEASSRKTSPKGAAITDNRNIDGIINTGHSPLKNRTSSSKTGNSSPNKGKVKAREESPIKIPKLSPGKISPRKRQRQSSCSPVKGKAKLKRMNVGKEQEEVSPLQNGGEVMPKKLILPQEKVQKMKKKEVFIDSFDIIPAVNEEPKFAYCGDVVRKKAARKQLEGWQCHECESWYKGQDLSSEEIKRLMNKCSRHRSKHNPVTNTPKNFWNPDWTDED